MATSRFVLGVAVSLGIHVGAFVHMHSARANVKAAPPVVIELDTSAPPPPAVPLPPPAPVAPGDDHPAPSPLRAAAKAAPAQAGKVLAAAADDGPADFTMVQGNAATYAGGVTTAAGTSRTAGIGAGGAPAARASGPTGGGGGAVDRSRKAQPIGSDWDCSSLFPSGATTDSATVVIVARVRPDGAPEAISVVADPGHGFGAAARACALRQRYAAAADPDGRPITASTAPFRVRFTR